MCVALLTAAAGCGGGAKDHPGQVRAVCGKYVKDRVKPPVTFSYEKVAIGAVRSRATLHGIAEMAIASPAPGGLGPTRIRRSFTCSVRRNHGRWRLVALTGLNS
ncbi:hypothetical protein GCM10023191_034740 [Actinoallomurus oryzae]|uniref:Lipoprotein n=2 Tax=Actinoallomurus oryzae TaxID=502180 RepID=A0ABP8PXS5_9ACTN